MDTGTLHSWKEWWTWKTKCLLFLQGTDFVTCSLEIKVGRQMTGSYQDREVEKEEMKFSGEKCEVMRMGKACKARVNAINDYIPRSVEKLT
ncbi:hypothetical protein chiPu_0009668 [Chiloscyllium punctatum]|uniref:Uncharacterized protein n=1 Tax=Chiloscyllium punctatum TaxID=137246 RepID=A0A401SLG1_CHIPU|nr:hypothetical protein [Chiloscyllium punctatum]